MITGYLERPYLADSYLSGFNDGVLTGAQVRMVVDRQAATHMQVMLQVLDKLNALHVQLNQVVNADGHTLGQVTQQVDATNRTPTQVLMRVVDKYVQLRAQADMVLEAVGMPVKAQVQQVVDKLGTMEAQVLSIVMKTTSVGTQVNMQTDGQRVAGMQQKISPLFQHLQPNYLQYAYLTTPYLAAEMHALQGVQVAMNSTVNRETFAQVNQVILRDVIPHMQANMVVFKEIPLASQVAMRILDRPVDTPMQVNQQIADHLVRSKSQVLMQIVDHEKPLRMQVLMVKAADTQAQVTMVIYNTTQLRMLRQFPSRGTPALGGTNWVSDPPPPAGDFSPNNLNTDVIEQCWRTPDGVTALASLICDTGLPQGAFVDTAAILGHNLTRSATVTLQGSAVSDFSTVGFSTVLNSEELNTYYISPDLPTAGFRYWRFLIEDPTNPDGYLKIGTIIFGASEIFSTLESFTNPIVQGQKHFKDVVETEGFTNVSNDRALRRYLQLNFQALLRNNGNFRKLEETYMQARTGLKVLYIPTPTYPSRFAIFGKLTSMPETTHTSNGVNEEYIDLKLDIDESL
jgi:hypothetical protein